MKEVTIKGMNLKEWYNNFPALVAIGGNIWLLIQVYPFSIFDGDIAIKFILCFFAVGVISLLYLLNKATATITISSNGVFYKNLFTSKNLNDYRNTHLK